MNCASFINIQDLHAEGRLTRRLARAADAHLAGCASCRALVPSSASAGTARAPASLKARLAAAARSASAPVAPGPGDLPLWPREARALVLAAALLLLVGWMIRATGVPSQSDAAASVEEP